MCVRAFVKVWGKEEKKTTRWCACRKTFAHHMRSIRVWSADRTYRRRDGKKEERLVLGGDRKGENRGKKDEVGCVRKKTKKSTCTVVDNPSCECDDDGERK